MKNVIYVLVALYTFSLVEAHANPLAIGSVYMGMSLGQVIKDPKTQCRLKGMIYKYNVCIQNEVVRNVPVKVEYYFDQNSLDMINLTFNKTYLEDILSYTYETYGSHADVDQESNTIRWVLPEGEIFIYPNFTKKNICEMKILSQKAVDKYLTRLEKHSIN